jgi:ABC-type multidrug transport system ATPase subunit
VVSSHVLRDVERVVDWIVCLERGRVVVDAALDDLHERYAEWRVSSKNGALPARFAEGFVVEQRSDAQQAVLIVRDARDARRAFEERHHVEVESAPLNLERMFPLWTKEARP